MTAEKEIERRVEMGVMAQQIKTISDQTTQMHKILVGNSKEGLVTCVAVLKSSVKRAWYFIALIFTILLGAGIGKLLG